MVSLLGLLVGGHGTGNSGDLLGEAELDSRTGRLDIRAVAHRAIQLFAVFGNVVIGAVGGSRILHPELEVFELGSRDVLTISQCPSSRS